MQDNENTPPRVRRSERHKSEGGMQASEAPKEWSIRKIAAWSAIALVMVALISLSGKLMDAPGSASPQPTQEVSATDHPAPPDAEQAVESFADQSGVTLPLTDLSARPTATPSATPTATNASAAPSAIQVWVAQGESDKEYHADAACGNLVNAYPVTLENAVMMGLDPCERCKPPVLENTSAK